MNVDKRPELFAQRGAIQGLAGILHMADAVPRRDLLGFQAPEGARRPPIADDPSASAEGRKDEGR